MGRGRGGLGRQVFTPPAKEFIIPTLGFVGRWAYDAEGPKILAGGWKSRGKGSGKELGSEPLAELRVP